MAGLTLPATVSLQAGRRNVGSMRPLYPAIDDFGSSPMRILIPKSAGCFYLREWNNKKLVPHSNHGADAAVDLMTRDVRALQHINRQ